MLLIKVLLIKKACNLSFYFADIFCLSTAIVRFPEKNISDLGIRWCFTNANVTEREIQVRERAKI